ncbi:hypothetical protein A1D29_09250 [Pasteurellaceae bacterium Orientalotternb1]|nr:hypothetical protein A1D29_09250 [Pasteurellaceae bacterium Orientalotternb1]
MLNLSVMKLPIFIAPITVVQRFTLKGLEGGKYRFTDSPHLKARANKSKKHNEKREVRVSQYIEMLNQDVAKVREEKEKAVKK